MANIGASGGAFSRGYSLDWTLSFDDVANTVTVNAVYNQPSGTVEAAPQVANLTVVLDVNTSITLNLITARLSTGQLFDGNSATMLNSGPRTRTGIRLKVSPDRAAAISFSTDFQPPA